MTSNQHSVPAADRLRALTDKYEWEPHREAHAAALAELVEQLEAAEGLLREVAKRDYDEPLGLSLSLTLRGHLAVSSPAKRPT